MEEAENPRKSRHIISCSQVKLIMKNRSQLHCILRGTFLKSLLIALTFCQIQGFSFAQGSTCCQQTQVSHFSNPEFCCSRLATDCPVKNISISVTNGTLGNVTFGGASASCYTNLVNSPLTAVSFIATCTPLPGFVVTVCPKPTANPVTVTYTINFTNGQTCTKVDVFECVLNCCKTTQVFNSSNVDGCCGRLITQCPVKSVAISITNGSLGTVSFAGTSAGFFTGVTNSAATSATFIANGTPSTGINMTICPRPTANPITINYVITFTNGQKCEKKDVFSCKFAPCTINACIGYATSGLSATFVPFVSSNFPIVLYYWEFGDGATTYTTSATTPSHTYPSAGTYTVCLTVYTSFGGDICLCKKKVCRTVTVIQGVASHAVCFQPLIEDPSDSDMEEAFSKIVVSPNPSSGDFHIVLEKAETLLSKKGIELKVVDLNGIVVFTQALSIGQTELDIETKGFPKGLYFVTLAKEGKIVATAKMIKN